MSSGDSRGVDFLAALRDEREDLSGKVTLQGSNGVELGMPFGESASDVVLESVRAHSPKAAAGVRPSTGSVGDAYDNALCESFFATLECELIDRHRFRSHSEARMAVFQFIEGFYNLSRRHSALGYLSPIEYQRKHDGLRADPGTC